MNIKEVAKIIDCSSETIRKYEKEFNLEIKRDSKNNRNFNELDIKKLSIIKEFRLNKTKEEIIQHLNNLNLTSNKDKLNIKEEIQKEELKDTNTNSIELQLNLQKIQQTILNKIDNILAVSENYSKATFEIGKLKTENEYLKNEKDKLEIQLKQIEDKNKTVDEIKLQLEEAIKQNQDKENIIKELSLKLEEQQKIKPWYKRIFSKG